MSSAFTNPSLHHPARAAWFALLLAIGLFTGCQSASHSWKTKTVEPPDTSPRSSPPAEQAAPALPVTTPAATQDVSAVVRLRPGLVVNMTVLVSGKKEIEETAKRISDKGTMVLPLLGTLEVKDCTLEQLGDRLNGMYKKYFVNPQVIVEFVRDANAEGISPWGYVTVLGRVKNPGRIALPATRDLTVSGGIQKAGGFNTSAKTDAILVTRRTPDGKSTTREIDLNAVGADGRTEDDIVVEADDVVFVPESRF